MEMQSSDLNNHLSTSKVEADNMSGRSVLQSLPLTLTCQTSAATYSQATISTSTFTNTTVRSEKPTNGSTVTQASRFVPTTSVNVSSYHIPKGTAAVANISMPKGKVSTPLVRTTPVPPAQSVTTVSGCSSSTFIPSLTRPVSTWVVTNTTAPALLQKTAALNSVSSTYVRPSSSLTVTSRITAPIVTKPSESSVKPIIIHNAPKQLITPAPNQLSERNTGGMLKTNVGMVTIRGSTITPALQPQTRLSVPAQTSQSPRLTMLLPTASAVRKPQTLAPKVITQTSRAPFTVQSIPVSVSHTPSALTMNKKTAGITISSNQASISVQNTSPVVRANPTVVPSNSLITVSDIRSTPSTNLLIQATPKPQTPMLSNANTTAFSAPAKTYMYDSENFQVKRTLVSSSTTAFTSTVTSLPTTAIPRQFNVVSSVNANQIPRLNPIMVLETPRIATAVTSSTAAPLQSSSALTIQSYMIPPGTSLGPVHQTGGTSLGPVHQTGTSLGPVQPPPPPPAQQLQLQQPPQQPQRLSPVPQQPPTPLKQNASPRPSILRKRDIDGSMAKAQRNLGPLLNTVSVTSTTAPSPPPSPHLPDVGGGQSSNSSSTLSATSSPGIPSMDPESPTAKVEKPQVTIAAPPCDEEQLRSAASLVEMSPRKKPRKQQLTVTSTNEPKLEDEMEFISDDKIKKESKDTAEITITTTAAPIVASMPVQETPKASTSPSSSSKKRNMSILSGYSHGWKSRHHHFLRYNDVKYKEDKKPSVNDIANQKYVTQKINGWKIYHLSSQMEDLHDIEIEVVDKLSSLLKLFSSQEEGDTSNKSLDRTNELIKGNMQRSKVVSDQLKEAKSQMMKVFNHKKHVSDIINKYASKRTIRKKGRY